MSVPVWSWILNPASMGSFSLVSVYAQQVQCTFHSQSYGENFVPTRPCFSATTQLNLSTSPTYSHFIPFILPIHSPSGLLLTDPTLSPLVCVGPVCCKMVKLLPSSVFLPSDIPKSQIPFCLGPAVPLSKSLFKCVPTAHKSRIWAVLSGINRYMVSAWIPYNCHLLALAI